MTIFKGIRLLSDEGVEWIEHQTGVKVNRAELSAFELPWANPRRLHGDAIDSTSTLIELPRRNIVELYLMRYISSFQNLVFPVISKSLFMGTLDLAYGLREVFGYASAKACVYSLLSLVCLFGLDDNEHELLDCGAYVSEAQRLVPSMIQEMTVDGLQSLTMLVSWSSPRNCDSQRLGSSKTAKAINISQGATSVPFG